MKKFEKICKIIMEDLEAEIMDADFDLEEYRQNRIARENAVRTFHKAFENWTPKNAVGLDKEDGINEYDEPYYGWEQEVWVGLNDENKVYVEANGQGYVRDFEIDEIDMAKECIDQCLYDLGYGDVNYESVESSKKPIIKEGALKDIYTQFQEAFAYWVPCNQTSRGDLTEDMEGRPCVAFEDGRVVISLLEYGKKILVCADQSQDYMRKYFNFDEVGAIKKYTESLIDYINSDANNLEDQNDEKWVEHKLGMESKRVNKRRKVIKESINTVEDAISDWTIDVDLVDEGKRGYTNEKLRKFAEFFLPICPKWCSYCESADLNEYEEDSAPKYIPMINIDQVIFIMLLPNGTTVRVEDSYAPVTDFRNWEKAKKYIIEQLKDEGVEVTTESVDEFDEYTPFIPSDDQILKEAMAQLRYEDIPYSEAKMLANDVVAALCGQSFDSRSEFEQNVSFEIKENLRAFYESKKVDKSKKVIKQSLDDADISEAIERAVYSFDWKGLQYDDVDVIAQLEIQFSGGNYKDEYEVQQLATNYLEQHYRELAGY